MTSYFENKAEENFNYYGEVITEAHDAIYRLKTDIDNSDCSDETATELTLMVEEETEDLPSIEFINWEDEEEVTEIAYIASDIIDYCNHFFEIYETIIAEII